MSTPVLSIDNPRGTINVNGPMIMNGAINGPFITFLTDDDTVSRTVYHAGQAIVSIHSVTWDVPSEYNHLQTKDLEIDACVDWVGETVYSWDAVFKLRLHYGPNLTSYVDSTGNADPGIAMHGCGIIAQTHHSDFNSTMDGSRVQSRFFIPNCPVSAGSQLKLELRFQCYHANTVYTNRDKGDSTNNFNHERGTTNYFMLIK